MMATAAPPMMHIVMWRLLEGAQGRTVAENAALMKAELETMRGRIPGLMRLDVGIDTRRRANSYDVVLICEFESAEALEAYHDHPAHNAVKPLVQAVRGDTVIVDYAYAHPGPGAGEAFEAGASGLRAGGSIDPGMRRDPPCAP